MTTYFCISLDDKNSYYNKQKKIVLKNQSVIDKLDTTLPNGISISLLMVEADSNTDFNKNILISIKGRDVDIQEKFEVGSTGNEFVPIYVYDFHKCSKIKFLYVDNVFAFSTKWVDGVYHHFFTVKSNKMIPSIISDEENLNIINLSSSIEVGGLFYPYKNEFYTLYRYRGTQQYNMKCWEITQESIKFKNGFLDNRFDTDFPNFDFCSFKKLIIH